MEAEGPAMIAARTGPPYRVALCWLLVDTAANRRLVARYPEILKTRFPGSSFGWAHCLTGGSPPPDEAGIAWVDTRTRRDVPLGFPMSRGLGEGAHPRAPPVDQILP